MLGRRRIPRDDDPDDGRHDARTWMSLEGVQRGYPSFFKDFSGY